MSNETTSSLIMVSSLSPLLAALPAAAMVFCLSCAEAKLNRDLLLLLLLLLLLFLFLGEEPWPESSEPPLSDDLG